MIRMRTMIGCLLALAGSAWGASTATWEMNAYQDFLRGRFSGISLSWDGKLSLAPTLDVLFSSGQPAIWTLVQAPDGTIYAGTGHRGRVYRIDKSGKGSVYWTADQPEVFALAIDPKGVLYAATSPEGRIYRLENGKATEFYTPKAKYIWSLAFAKDGTLYAGTGDEGKIFRVDPAGRGGVYYETGQVHITALSFDAQGRLFAGSEPNGLLYRISAKDKAFILYNASLPEIRKIIPAPNGAIYAVALGGSTAAKAMSAAAAAMNAAAGAAVSSNSASITVDASAQAGPDLKPKADAAQAAPAQPQVTAQVTPIMDLSGVDKSAVYEIHPDNTVETLWSSKDENIYDLISSAGQLYFSTDASGRIYHLSADRKSTLLAQTNEGEATRLIATPGGMLAATADMGKVFRMGIDVGPAGAYESPIHDTGTVARWGRLSWRGEGTVIFRTRSGNSARPDRTWSDWSEPIRQSGGAINCPNARFVQWKSEFQGGATEPSVANVVIAYLPQNNPPVVRSISVNTQASNPSQAQKSASAQSSPTASYSITVTDTGDTGASSLSGTPTQMLTRSLSQQTQIAWQADDQDGDRLVYAVYFRGEDEREWKLLKADLYDSSLLLDADALADGRYYFRVVASDRPSNPPDIAREADLVSAPVLIDNTPPVVSIGAPRRSGARVALDVEAQDATSPLRRCEYSVDAGAWIPLQALDGVIDSPHEQFRVTLETLTPGEHLAVVRAYDSAGNAGLAKIVLR